MTAEFYKNIYQKTYLPNKQIQTENLRKQERMRKISNWIKSDSSSESPSRKKVLVVAINNDIEADFKVF